MKYLILIIFSVYIISNITSQSNVGINIPNPTESLDVNGNINLTGTIKVNGQDGSDGQVLTNTGSGTLQWMSTTSNNSDNIGYGTWGDCGNNQNLGNYNPVLDTLVTQGMGNDVDINGNFAIVGARNDNSTSVYQLVGNEWIFFQRIVKQSGFPSGGSFGSNVVIDGNRIVISCPFEQVGNNTGQGAVYLYEFDGVSWIFRDRIVHASGKADDNFGTSVAIEGNLLVVGIPYWDVSNFYNDNSGGVAVIFIIPNGYYHHQTLTESVNGDGHQFGSYVVIENFKIIASSIIYYVGPQSRGSVSLYTYDGDIWTFAQRVTDINPSTNSFGYKMAMHGNDLMVISASNTPHPASGQCNHYKLINNLLVYQSTIKNFAAADYDRFGCDVSVNDKYLMIGSYGINDDRGASMLYIKVGNRWKPHETITEKNINIYGSFGVSNFIDTNNRFVVGAYNAYGTGMAFFGKVLP